MGVVTVPPAATNTTVVESATIPAVSFAVPVPPAAAVPPPTVSAAAPTLFPVTTAAMGALTASVHAYHPSIHCAPMGVTTTSMVSIRAAKCPVAERPPLHIVAVVDTSGSMNQDNKLVAVKAALRFVVASMSNDDRFGLVTFDDVARVVVQPTTAAGAGRVQQQINGMTAQGRTNLSGGIQTGVNLLLGGMPNIMAFYPPSMVPPPPVPPHLLHASSRAVKYHPSSARALYLAPAAAMAPVPVATAPVAPLPPFYVGVTRTNVEDDATLKIEATLPAYVSHLEVTSAGNIGALQWKSGSPAMAVWPAGPLTFKVVFTTPNFQPCAQTVDLASGVATYLTVTPQATTAPATTAPAAVARRPASQPKVPIQLVMVFTDGEANVGISDAKTLSRKTSEWMAATCPDASLITFGFGATHNAKLLRSLATATQGTYYHVPTASDIPKLFGDCLGGFMSVAARKISVTIQPASPFVTINDVQTTYPSSVDSRGQTTVALKDLFSEERRDLIVNVTVHPSALAVCESLPLFKVTVASRDALGSPMPAFAVVAATPVVELPYMGLPNTDVDEQIGRIAAAVAVDKATDLASAGNFDAARVVLHKARAKQCATRSSYARCVDLELEEMESNLSPAAWASTGYVVANAMQAQHAQQRCNRPAAQSAAYYQTEAKAACSRSAMNYAGAL